MDPAVAALLTILGNYAYINDYVTRQETAKALDDLLSTEGTSSGGLEGFGFGYQNSFPVESDSFFDEF